MFCLDDTFVYGSQCHELFRGNMSLQLGGREDKRLNSCRLNAIDFLLEPDRTRIRTPRHPGVLVVSAVGSGACVSKASQEESVQIF